jgi:hypothetical protein
VPSKISSPTTGQLTWGPNDHTPRTIEVQVVDDNVVQALRYIDVVLSNPSAGKIGANWTASIAVTDNDSGFAFYGPTLLLSESVTPIVVPVQRMGPATKPASVTWSSANGTAIAGKDFGTKGNSAQLGGTLTWAAGDSKAKLISVPIIADTETEGAETFTLKLSAPSAGMQLGDPSVIVVTIFDDDTAPKSSLQFSQPKYVVLESGGTATLEVQRTAVVGPITNGATVNFATQPGTALASSDYTAKSGTLTWPVGDASPRQITIDIHNDAVAEPLENFKVVLSNPSSGTMLGPNSAATVTIVDDDEAFPALGAMPDGWVVPASATKGWHVSSDAGAFEGAYSLRSDAIGDGQKAQVEVTRVFAAGNVAFRVKVSSEPVFDRLRFFVDGVEKGTWSGTATTGWTLFTTPITAGTHTLRWSYEKDGAISVGSDAAWIDAVTLP